MCTGPAPGPALGQCSHSPSSSSTDYLPCCTFYNLEVTHYPQQLPRIYKADIFCTLMMLTTHCACNKQHTLTGVRSRTAMGCSVGARMGSSRTYRLKRVNSIKMSVTSALRR